MNEDNFYLAEIISDFFYNAVLLFNAFILACSAVRIRKTIKSLHNVFPNEGFIKVHVANSILYTILYTVYIITVLVLFKIADADDIPDDNKSKKRLRLLKAEFFSNMSYIVVDVFTFYMDLFLLYLILRFTKGSKKESGKDKMLEKKVPSILYI